MARWPDASWASISALSGLGGQGLSTRSTGQVGLADILPCRPVTGPGGVAPCAGDGLVEAAGDADGETGADGETEGEGDPVDVTLGETATATGGKVDSRQAASASKPTNAGRATPSYRIPRP